MQPELRPVRTDDQAFGRGSTYEPVQELTCFDNVPTSEVEGL